MHVCKVVNTVSKCSDCQVRCGCHCSQQGQDVPLLMVSGVCAAHHFMSQEVTLIRG